MHRYIASQPKNRVTYYKILKWSFSQKKTQNNYGKWSQEFEKVK